MIRVTPKYEAALYKRNAAQREAIETLQGPVLVIAGPGTGKTDVLSLRIGNILVNSDAAASNILCLTYTEAGASEMRARLLEYIGPEANNVRIQTFHGFCNSVIQEHLEVFGGTQELKPVSDLEKIEILIEIIDEFDDNNPLRRRRGDVHYERWSMRALHELMKGEGWSADFVHQKIDAWLEEAKTHEDFIYKRNTQYGAKGDLREKAYQGEVEKMQVLRAAVDTFGRYVQKLSDRQRYDYADMLTWVRDAFRSNPDLLLDYQERFQYLLVDEFQDTNGIQLELIKLLAAYEHPNVFVVGDDDQAIFRFQGALVKNIADFYHSFNPGVITLSENYRSSWPVLQAASEVIQHNRLDPQLKGLSFHKNITAAGPAADFHEPPRILSFRNRDQEVAFLGEELTALHRDGILERESVAVIYRRHVLSDHLMRVLQFHEVPFVIARDVNMLEEPMINHVTMILEYVVDQYLSVSAGDDALFAIMHFRHFGVPPRDIAKVADACKAVRDDHGFKEGRKALRDLIADRKKLKSLNLLDPGKTVAFGGAIEELCGVLHDDTPPAFIERLLHITGLLHWIVLQPEREWYLELIKTLMEHCIRETDLQPGLTLGDYVGILRKHREHRVAVPVVKAVHAVHGIEMITAHGAKGHEYDRVYLMGCTKQDWEDFRGNRNESYGFPKNLVAERRDSSIEDDRRLFYVAMTRARRYLTISFPASDFSYTNLEPSRFIAELAAGIDTPEVTEVAQEKIDVYRFYEMILERKTQFPELIDRDLVDRVLADYRLSATDFNLFLECPRSFYFEKMLRVPATPQLYFTFGNVIHKSLEILFSQYWDTLFMNKETLLRVFAQQMEQSRGRFTERQYEDTMIHGKESLELYAEAFEPTWRDPDRVITEYRVDQVTHRGIPIKGFLDKVEIRPSTVQIIDYKTGRFESRKFMIPDVKNPDGGAFWRQMIFYKILLQEDPSQDWNVEKGIMDFVDVKRNKQSRREEIRFDPAEIAFVSDLMVKVYDRIKAYDFDHRCDRRQCTWCELIDSEFLHDDPSGRKAPIADQESGADSRDEL